MVRCVEPKHRNKAGAREQSIATNVGDTADAAQDPRQPVLEKADIRIIQDGRVGCAFVVSITTATFGNPRRFRFKKQHQESVGQL